VSEAGHLVVAADLDRRSDAVAAITVERHVQVARRDLGLRRAVKNTSWAASRVAVELRGRRLFSPAEVVMLAVSIAGAG
jgi:hypothetical protein